MLPGIMGLLVVVYKVKSPSSCLAICLFLYQLAEDFETFNQVANAE